MSSLLDYHLQPLAQKVKSYIKDTNHLLSKLKSLGKLPQGAILCTIVVVGHYPNIPHSEGLTSLGRSLELRDEKTFKQVCGAAVGTKVAPPYAVLFMADLEEKILNAFEEKPMI